MKSSNRKRKFNLALHPNVYDLIEKIAVTRGLTIQEYLRAVVIPDGLRADNPQMVVHMVEIPPQVAGRNPSRIDGAWPTKDNSKPPITK